MSDGCLLIVSSHSGGREAGKSKKSMVMISVPIRTLILLDQGLMFTNSFHLNYLLIGPVSKCSDNEWGVGPSKYESDWWRIEFSP